MSHPATPPAVQPQRRHKIFQLLALMGPAFVVGAWQFGPGNLASAVQAGSRFGYSLIWVIAVSTLLMIMFTDMSIRIAVSSRGSLIETVKDVLGRFTGGAAGIGVFAITLMFSVGNAVGSGLGLSLTLGGSPVWWTLACTAAVAAILFARRLYGLVEKILLVIVATMAVSFVVTAVLSGPDWSAAAGGLVPSVPAGTGLLLVALVGTNFSINAAFYTGYAARERGLRRDQYRDTTLADTVPGIVAPGVMTALVIVAAAAVLPGSDSNSLAQLAGVLEPIAGPVGRIVFALGFFGAAFSSMIANAVAGGTLLADGFGYGNRLSSLRVRLGILGVLAFGAAVTVLAGSGPVQLIIVAQALTVVVAPLLGVLLVVLANNRRLMGDLRNTWWQNVLSTIGLIAILATCYRLVATLLN
ncbi:NRAMP (natural resistance-associated macrophage protein)-like metal ion transporter [Pseudonocardia hierapolitana]|uniref:NRAMP (Natural resistance-associated macrophage protein)-like metal ion transporter n=1 Tax=Pseudonocardia hierapolitana TaxID=1128676 RepID=A0A561T0V4_9PSEU|nr:Nramp family divalent metal transporter [Pseudonocardia hierapolitana]TWF80756.1 NRAMP (natural resistance-associated macrophage protein)-like metal ion transporter [Pseudonocardia hierapolitana]